MPPALPTPQKGQELTLDDIAKVFSICTREQMEGMMIITSKEMELSGACERPPGPHVYLKLIDVLMDKPKIWRLNKNHVYTVGVEPSCDIVLPLYGYKSLLTTADPRIFTRFQIRFVESTGHWWVERMFDQVQFHQTAGKRWLRTVGPNGRPSKYDAPDGLVMCILNPNSCALLQHGDIFQFRACASPPHMIARFEFLFKPESPNTDEDMEADGVFPLLNLPDLALAKVASHLHPDEFLNNLHVASPSIGVRLRHTIPWRGASYDDSLDNIRLTKMTCPSEVRSVYTGEVPKEKDVKFPELFESMLKVFTGNKLTSLHIRKVEDLLLFPVPRSLKTIVFQPETSERANWKTLVGKIDFPSTINCVQFLCERADAAPYDLRARVFDIFPKATKYAFYPSPSELFWDDVLDEALEDITHFHVRLDLASDFPVDRLDSMKELVVFVTDPLVLTENGFFFTVCPNLEGMCINLMVLGEGGCDEFWSALKERAPKLTYFKIMTVKDELFMAPKVGTAVCDDEFVMTYLLEYWPGFTILILHDVVVSVAVILKLIKVAKSLNYLEVRTRTPFAFVPSSIRHEPGESVTVQWYQPPAEEENPGAPPELHFVFTTLPEREVTKIGKLFQI